MAFFSTCHKTDFRSLHSTPTALNKAIHSWAWSSYDLKKAFDTVDDDILLKKC